MSDYASRYSCQPIAALWTLEAQYGRWFQVWRALSHAIGHPIEWEALDRRVQWVEESLRLEEKYGHDVAAACEALRNRLFAAGQTDAARWLHYGACSSDIVDAGWTLAIRDANSELTQLAREVIEEVGRHAEFGWGQSKAVMRTHGQAAMVARGRNRWITLWSQLNGLLGNLASPELVGFAGPTGDGGELTINERIAISRELGGMGLRTPGVDTGQAAPRAGWVKWLQEVAALATWCERFGTQVRLLAQTGIDEVTEGRGDEYRGSSSMPHKSNPTRSERLCGLAPVVRGLVNGYAESAASLWDAHSLEHSSAERIVIPQVTELVGFMLVEAADIAETLVVHPTMVERNVSVAPADSYAEKNRLVREGADGGEAWIKAAQQAYTVVQQDQQPEDGITRMTERTGRMSQARRDELRKS